MMPKQGDEILKFDSEMKWGSEKIVAPFSCLRGFGPQFYFALSFKIRV